MRDGREFDLYVFYSEVEVKCNEESRRSFMCEIDGRCGLRWDEERKRDGDVMDV